MTHGHEKSRSAVVAVKPTNKAERSTTTGHSIRNRQRSGHRRFRVSNLAQTPPSERA
jgi:hypothetical protein